MRNLLIACVSVLAGCGGLQLTLVDSSYQRPSNVAVFFTVQASSGDPIPGLTAADFQIYEDGALVSIDESNQTIINPELAAEHYTLLLVDMSGSVTESDQVPLIVQAATNFTSTLGEYQRVAVYAFDGGEQLYPMQPFTTSEGASTRAVASLENFRTRDPSTNLHGAVVQATTELNTALERSSTPLRFGTIVVFTDGTDRAHRVSFDEMIDAVDQAGVDVFAIGVGNEIDEGTLSSIGFSGYVLVQDSAAINAAFEAVTNRIVSYTRSHYLLSYCSPARAGAHEVTIEANLEDYGSGSLSYSFDAEGFGPNCDPGRPPPFDTTGRAMRRYQVRPSAGARIEVNIEASAEAGAN
ncbi:MAG: VWA domain-containing protein [Myxococcota bacterium]